MTKDEIKKGLLYCQDYDWDNCVDCPYVKSKRTGGGARIYCTHTRSTS